MAERRSLQEPRPEIWRSAASDFNWFASGSQRVCCANVPLWSKSWTGRFTQSFLHQECWSLLTSCFSQFSHRADVGSLDLPSVLEPLVLYRTDGKRPDGVTMIPWKWVNSWCGMSRLCMLLHPAVLIKALYVTREPPPLRLKCVKLRSITNWIDNGYTFQPVALDVQGSLSESSEVFITRLCKLLCRSHDDQRAGSFLKQRISMAL